MQVIAIPKSYIPEDYERIPFTTSAVVALTASKLVSAAGKPVKAVYWTIEGNTARWRDDGGDPSTGDTGNGSPFPVNTGLQVNGFASCKQSRWIGLSGAGAIHAHYYY